MLIRISALVFSFAIFTACASQAPTPASSAPGGDRTTASTENMFWIPHPCGSPGTPFRKYSAFALDVEKGVIYGRKDATSPPVEIKDKPNGLVAWDSVNQFLEEKGIYAACGNAANTTPAPTPAEPSAPVSRGPFREPIQLNQSLYYKAISRRTEGTKNVLRDLHVFLSCPHLQKPGRPDVVISACPQKMEAGAVCVQQRKLNYEEARRLLFGNLDLRQGDDGKYEVFDYYCQKWVNEDDFRAAANSSRESKDDLVPGPNNIPFHGLVNCEHSWPQSKFTETGAAGEVQKTDLHHIFPTDTKVNADRGNWDFAEVDQNGAQTSRCGEGRVGVALPINGEQPIERAKYFQPPPAFRGDLARALFYFSARYNAGMAPLQEGYLRKWNVEDPPDEMEIARNEKAYKLMGVRNPFVDDAKLADRIPRFCRGQWTKRPLAKSTYTAYDCK